MSAVRVVAQGPVVYVVPAGTESPRPFRATERSDGPARPGADPHPDHLPRELVDTLGELGADRSILASPTRFAGALSERLRRPVGVLASGDLALLRRRLPRPDAATERPYLLSLARLDLERGLRAPEEVLVTLAREEERLVRAVGREARAAAAFVEVPGSALSAYAERWKGARSALERHHAELVPVLEGMARSLVPNLCAVVGPRVAARLVASAGGVAALGRLRASRLQLLGSRRRPSPDRGPRYGVLYNAERMGDVPPDRRGAYARSLAALASIAARADSTTHADLSPALVGRRDRRVAQLARARR